MRISDKGADFIAKFEAVALKPYYATPKEKTLGIVTIGVGMTHYPDGKAVKITDAPLTRDQAMSMFKELLKSFEDKIRPSLTKTPTQNQWDAMVSLAYNIGTGGFAKSSVVRLFNTGNIEGSADAFLMWNKQAGKVLNGLTRRRTAEREMFLHGVY